MDWFLPSNTLPRLTIWQWGSHRVWEVHNPCTVLVRVVSPIASHNYFYHVNHFISSNTATLRESKHGNEKSPIWFDDFRINIQYTVLYIHIAPSSFKILNKVKGEEKRQKKTTSRQTFSHTTVMKYPILICRQLSRCHHQQVIQKIPMFYPFKSHRLKPWNDQVPDRHVPPSLQTPAAWYHHGTDGTAPAMSPTGNAWAASPKEMPPFKCHEDLESEWYPMCTRKIFT